MSFIYKLCLYFKLTIKFWKVSVIFSTKKYFLLAVIGALIIGVGTYLFLTSYFERVEVLVASTVLKEGKKLEEKDLSLKQYYKNSIPEGFIQDKNEVLGKIIKIERRAGDPITSEVFEKDLNQSAWNNISEGEVLLAVDIGYNEPLAEELKAGSIISIISTVKEKDLPSTAVKNNFSNNNDNGYYYNSKDNEQALAEISAENSLSHSTGQGTGQEAGQSTGQGTAQGTNTGINTNINTDSNQNINTGINTVIYKDLSENIIVVDSQIVVRNLEIIDIRKQAIQESNILIGSKKGSYYIFLKCTIGEAPIISRVTKENNYKIIMEKL
ncbi:MAG: hypothetical protein FJW56_02615 [Actinobacteria bacterium]|nr:hypothetical protein [Actinomycetota bacterium]